MISSLWMEIFLKIFMLKKRSGLITTSILSNLFRGCYRWPNLKNKLFNEIEENQFGLNYYIDLSIRTPGKKMIIKWAEMKLLRELSPKVFYFFIEYDLFNTGQK